MLPEPLHPAVVHFPIVLAFLLPLFALGAIWAIRKGARISRAWSLPLAFAAALALSSWVAVQTGEAQEDRVENTVAESAFETHEEAAQVFLAASALLVLVTAAGLAPGLIGRSARVVAAVAAFALVIGAARVGHSGGQLAYQHGAAAVYATGNLPAGADTARLASAGQRRSRGDDDEN